MLNGLCLCFLLGGVICPRVNFIRSLSVACSLHVNIVLVLMSLTVRVCKTHNYNRSASQFGAQLSQSWIWKQREARWQKERSWARRSWTPRRLVYEHIHILTEDFRKRLPRCFKARPRPADRSPPPLLLPQLQTATGRHRI